MTLFFLWTGSLFFFLFFLFLYLRRRKQKGFKYQTRVTIMFLTMALLPAIPLILFTSSLINMGLDAIIRGDVADLLDDSITVIREQLIRNKSADLLKLDSYLLTGDISEIEADTSFIYIYMINGHADSIGADTVFYNHDNSFDTKSPVTLRTINSILAGDIDNEFDMDNRTFEVYEFIGDSIFLQVGMPIPESVAETISRIEFQSSFYGQVVLIKEGIINEQTIYLAGSIIVIILTVIAFAAGAGFSKGMTRPIKDLVLGFKKVGEGDLNTRINPNAKDELEYLMTSFNSMVSDLNQAQGRLLQSERIAAWRDVARQISHEIKNPLTPIQLSLHRIKNKINIPEENTISVSESFKTIEEEIESLRRIATEFSEFARIPKPNLIPCSLNEIINSAAALYEKNKINTEINIESTNIPNGMFDAEQMKRVFINLFTNSIDAVEKDAGIIQIAVSHEDEGFNGGKITVMFKDNGCGIENEKLKNIFDPYYTTKKHGTGLGMPVIKRIIEEHGGTIDVKSNPGKGTEVLMVFKVE